MSSLRSTAVAVLCTAVLAACGGGGGDAGSADAAATGDVAVKSRESGSASTATKTSGSTTTTAVAAAAVTTAPSGRLLASNCFQCHGTNGQSTSGFDRIAGSSVSEIAGELKEMQTSSGGEHGIMRVHALGYSDEQILSLAGFLASQSH